MKKTFTLLSLLMMAVTVFGQTIKDGMSTIAPENGKKYFIQIGNAGRKGFISVKNPFSNNAKSVALDLDDLGSQLWTCTVNDDNTYSFYNELTDFHMAWYSDRIKIWGETTVPEDYETTKLTKFNIVASEDGTACFIEVPYADAAKAERYMAVVNSRLVIGNANQDEAHAKVLFIEEGGFDLPTHDFNFADYSVDNTARYILFFDRGVGEDGQGTFAIGSTANLVTEADTLKQVLLPSEEEFTLDSVAKMRAAIWHFEGFDVINKKVKLVNELGQYAYFGSSDPNDNAAAKRFMARTNLPESTPENEVVSEFFLAAFKLKTERYIIGTDADHTTRNFMNAHGGIKLGGPVNKWNGNDGGSALYIAPIADVLSVSIIEQIDNFPTITSGINEVSVAPAAANGRIYTVDGRFVGNDLNSLPQGVYIVNGKKVVK